MQKRASLMRGTAVSLLLMTIPVGALAQNTEGVESDQPGSVANVDTETPSVGVEEIVVTAQRREQSLQDVPLAVSAFSGENLAAQQIHTTLDLPRYVPNMVGTNNVGLGSANTYFLRALGNTESIATFDPPVGSYVDDIYVSRQNANNFALFDVERIEVLRGPQGTLFGRNTTGGAINVILKRPGDELAGFVEGSYGRFDSWTLRGSVDLPASDKLLTKFSGFIDHSDGWLRNVTTGERLNGRESYGMRAAVRLLPTETIIWDMSLDYIYDNSLSLPGTEVNDRYFSRTGLSEDVASLRNLVVGEKGSFELQNKVSAFNVTSNLNIELGEHALELITGYRTLAQDYALDIFDGPFPTGGFALANEGDFEQFSQEVKLTGDVGDTVDYVAGLFYIYEDNKTDFADVFTLPIGETGFPLVLADRVLLNQTSAPAIYAQANWRPVPELTLTAGARYTHEAKEFELIANNNPQVAAPFDTDDITAFGVPTRQTIGIVTPRFAAQYEFSRNVMVFASATRGFRSGGWNARALRPEAFLPFSEERVWSYETGLRSDLFDRRLRFNATGFYTDIDGFQVPLGFIDETGAINFVTQNATDLRVYGLEIESTFVPTEGLSLFANVGLLNAKYTNPDAGIIAQQGACRAGDPLSCGQGIVDPSGDLAEPQRAPDFTASFGGSYEIPVSATLMLTPTVNFSYEAEKAIGTAGTPNDFVPDQLIVGAALGFGPWDDSWRLSLECSNCFDNATVGTFFPPAFFFHNPPMSWRIRAVTRF